MDVGFDLLFSGSLNQSAGMKDGTSADVSAQYFHISGHYKWKPTIVFMAGLSFAKEDFSFSGASERNAGITSGNRSDTSNLLGLGLRYQF